MDTLKSSGSTQSPEGLYLSRIEKRRSGQDLRQSLRFDSNPMDNFNNPMSNPLTQGNTVGQQREAVFGEASGGHQDLRDLRNQSSGSGGLNIFNRRKKGKEEKKSRSILARRIGK